MNPNPNPNPNERRPSTADLVRASRAAPPDAEIRRPPPDVPVRPEGDGRADDNRMMAAPASAAAATRAEAAAEAERLVALFAPDVCRQFRARWDEVQIGFVDDPLQAVKQADELVAQVMTSLAETFARERSQLESFMAGKGDGGPNTENLRVALQRYRSFFQRLLAL
jgi:hypothetical protein